VKRRVAAFACFAWLALSGCRTPPDAFSPAGWAALTAADPRPALRVAGLRELAETRHALRATARVGSEGPEGAVSTDQLLLVERPASLRVEVIGGVLQQRVLVLATDGTRYELYRAEGPVTEEGAVHAGVLEEVAGLPLTPEAAVRLLLAAPLAPDTPAESVQQDALGALRLRWPDQTLEFDGAGRLAALAFHPGEHGERAVLYARWSDWRALDTGAFPHRLELELPEAKTRWQLEYRQVELDPELDPALFRLGLGTR
jgi:hypothetical protein